MLNGSVAEYCEDLLSTTDSTNNTPMHIACAKGNIEALKVHMTCCLDDTALLISVYVIAYEFNINIKMSIIMKWSDCYMCLYRKYNITWPSLAYMLQLY